MARDEARDGGRAGDPIRPRLRVGRLPRSHDHGPRSILPALGAGGRGRPASPCLRRSSTHERGRLCQRQRAAQPVSARRYLMARRPSGLAGPDSLAALSCDQRLLDSFAPDGARGRRRHRQAAWQTSDGMAPDIGLCAAGRVPTPLAEPDRLRAYRAGARGRADPACGPQPGWPAPRSGRHRDGPRHPGPNLGGRLRYPARPAGPHPARSPPGGAYARGHHGHRGHRTAAVPGRRSGQRRFLAADVARRSTRGAGLRLAGRPGHVLRVAGSARRQPAGPAGGIDHQHRGSLAAPGSECR